MKTIVFYSVSGVSFVPIPILIIALIVIALVALYFVTRKYAFRGLAYEREFSDDGVFEGEEITLTETIINRTPFPIFGVDAESYIYKELEFRAYIPELDKNMQYVLSRFSLMPFMKIKRKHTIGCVKRGYYKIETATLWCGKLTNCVPSAAEIYVYPKIVESAVFPRPLSLMQGSSVSSRRLIEDPFSFAGIRDYRFGDSFSSINFKATAKAPITGCSSIKVNNCDFSANRNVKVMINFQTDFDEGAMQTEIYNELMELALGYSAGFMEEAIDEGYRVGFAANCSDIGGAQSMIFPMRSGSEHFRDILRGLAAARLYVGCSIIRLIDIELENYTSDTEFYFISTYVDEPLAEKLAELERAGNVLTVIKPDISVLEDKKRKF